MIGNNRYHINPKEFNSNNSPMRNYEDLQNFNSKQSAYTSNIPLETLKVVDELFGDDKDFNVLDDKQEGIEEETERFRAEIVAPKGTDNFQQSSEGFNLFEKSSKTNNQLLIEPNYNSQPYVNEHKPEDRLESYFMTNSNMNNALLPTTNNRQVDDIVYKNNNIDFDDLLKNVQFKDDPITNRSNSVQAKDKIPQKSSLQNQNSTMIRGNNNNGYIIDISDQMQKESVEQFDFNLKMVLEFDVPYGKIKHERETKDNIQNRKKNTLSNVFFSNCKFTRSSLSKRSLEEYLQVEEEPLNYEVQAIFEEMLLNSPDIETLKNKIETLPIITNDIIGRLRKLDETEQSLKRDGESIREILTDGNGFYRTFMFSVLEVWIQTKNIFSIKKLVYDLNQKLDMKIKKEDSVIDKNEVIQIFYLIIDLVERECLQEAYGLLVRSYSFSQSFDFGLIKYIRLTVGTYLMSMKDNIIALSNENGNLLPAAYENPNTFKRYVEEFIQSMHLEVEKIVLIIAPIIFNVNLDLHCLEGTNNDYHKKSIPCLFGDNKASNFASTIAIVYKDGCYHKLYKQIVNSDYKSSRFTVISNDIKCDNCKRSSMLIKFNHMPGLPLCNLCLIDDVNTIISRRIKNFSAESYYNREYYCRPITIDVENNFKLYNEDMVQLNGKNIFRQFLFFLGSVCPLCALPSECFVNMPCECSLCPSCVKEKINKDTDGKVILNAFEKRYLNIKPSLCACGLPFDVQSAIKITIKDESELINQANLRIVKYVERYCTMCRKQIQDKKSSIAQSNYVEFSIVPDSDPQVANVTHKLCTECIFPLRAQVHQLAKSGKIKSGSKHVPIKCCACVKTHQVEMRILRPLLKGEDGACCSIL